MRRALAGTLTIGLGALADVACAPATRPAGAAVRADNLASMNGIAESYVKLVLALGRHDADYVDAFYGPAEWKAEAERTKRPLPEIRAEAGRLLSLLAGTPEPAEELPRLRRRYLDRQLSALRAKAEMLGGRKFTFDEESRALYDVVAPTNTEEHFRAIRDELARLLPGTGPLGTRYEEFRRGFVIPTERLDAVFSAAIEAGRSRTKARISLPEGERFRVEKVNGKSWSGYNWYQGGFHSLIQVNTDLPIFIDRAVDLACHEGYPGHHVYNALLEKSLVRDRGWIEFTVYALFSPQSLIAEGSANFGIEVAFPGPERTSFERDVLYPIAGIDPSRAGRYAEIQKLVEGLSYAGNEAARRYLNGEISRSQAEDWLEEYGLSSRARAEQRVRFFDQYRSYVINYNLGKDLVRRWIESRGGTADHPDRRWAEFATLISSPRLPSDLESGR